MLEVFLKCGCVWKLFQLVSSLWCVFACSLCLYANWCPKWRALSKIKAYPWGFYHWLSCFSFLKLRIWRQNMEAWPVTFSSLDQPLHFSYTCSVDESLPGFQFHQWQYYPTDYVTREYLSYLDCQPSSNVSPSSDGKI